MSVSIENFVKTIWSQGKHPAGDTRLSTLAGLLNISKAAATDMARRLASKELVNYTKYKTFKLSLHEIHREAELLEHQTSDFMAERIDNYLGNPTVDPHGDPIPDLEGCISYNTNSLILSETSSGSYYTITRLLSTDEDFFHFCSKNQLDIGMIIKVENQYKYGNITEIFVDNRIILMHKTFSDCIYVEENLNKHE